MKDPVFYIPNSGGALGYAEKLLRQMDFRFSTEPNQSVTHLLLGVPAFEPDGSLKGGGSVDTILPSLSSNVTICGGMLQQSVLSNFKKTDLLEDPYYVAENARITAYCAVSLAMRQLPITLWQCPILVIGWGRIGKCLAGLLKDMSARVTVSARKASDRAILSALGYDTLDTQALDGSLARFRIIFNTVPEPILSADTAAQCQSDCLKIDLASRLGINTSDVIWARGLPGTHAPESSGKLIAQTLLRLL